MSHDPGRSDVQAETRCGSAASGVPADGCAGRIGPATQDALRRIEADLREFEQSERARLAIEEEAHWRDLDSPRLSAEDRERTTLLFGGLTAAHDALIEAGLRKLGYKAAALPYPDVASLQCGKEFGNRGQCNPTYFTVGNLVRELIRLRDVERVPVADIVSNYAFVTFGSCGPCRFGTYITEYRKALRDAGFAGFRVFALSQEAPDDSGETATSGLGAGLAFYLMVTKCVIVADILNVLGYRTRPYEIEMGATDAAIARSIDLVREAIAQGCSVLRVLRRVRRHFAGIRVNRLQPKPKVAIIGEFWAMTTEGDGNYRLQRFLEEEGAECDIQIITGWILYSLWCIGHDIRESTMLRRRAGEVDRYEGVVPRKGIFYVWFGMQALAAAFQLFARTAGLTGYKLPDMHEIADLAHRYYPTQLRGGEGHMEVGKVIQTAHRRKAHMVISVKPFGCMPSSGVSDGVQALVAARFPEVEFLAIETTGDSAVNAYSRVQMALFRARARAQAEFKDALVEKGISAESTVSERGARTALRYPMHRVAGTGANAVYELR